MNKSPANTVQIIRVKLLLFICDIFIYNYYNGS